MSSRPNTPYWPCVWSEKRLTLDTKLRIYQTRVLSVLLYATDTWTSLSADVRTLDAFHQKCLRQLLGIRWYDRVRIEEVLQQTGLTSLSHLLSHRRISVFGHVARLDDDTLANVALQLHINVHSTDLLTARGVTHLVVHETSGSTGYVTIPHVRLRPLETCCGAWWCSDASALAGYANLMIMMRRCRPLQGSRPYITHGSLGLPLSLLQTAPRSV